MKGNERMKTDAKIQVLAETTKAIIDGLHDKAPECGRCPLWGSPACMDGENYEIIQEIMEG